MGNKKLENRKVVNNFVNKYPNVITIIWIIFIILLIINDFITNYYSVLENGSVSYKAHNVFIFGTLIATIIVGCKGLVVNRLVGIFASALFCIMFIESIVIFKYTDWLEEKALKQSHIQLGYVFNKYSKLRARYTHDYIDVGISKELSHQHDLGYGSNDDLRTIFLSKHIGDTVILRVSDKYPCVNEVVNWNPTSEEIQKYKTPTRSTSD